MGNFIAALSVLVAGVGALWVVYQDIGRNKQLERVGAALAVAQPGSLERNVLQSLFDRLVLPMALEQLAPPRKNLHVVAWVLLVIGSIGEVLWVLLVADQAPPHGSWATYGVSLLLLLGGTFCRQAWKLKRMQWMREEMERRRFARLNSDFVPD